MKSSVLSTTKKNYPLYFSAISHGVRSITGLLSILKGQFILRQPQQLVLTLWHMMYPSAEAPRYMLGWRESPVGQTVMASSASLRLATYFILARSSLFFPHLIAGVNPCALWYLIICLNMLYGSIFSQRWRISPKHELVNWPSYTGSHNLLSA